MDVLGLRWQWLRWTELAAVDRFAPGIISWFPAGHRRQPAKDG